MTRHRAFKELLRMFWESTSIKGVPRALKSSTLAAQFFWGIATLGCLAMLLFQVCTLLVKYYQYLVAIQFTEQMVPPTFPEVTVCNSNPYDAYAKFDYTYKQYLNQLDILQAKAAASSSVEFDNDPLFWQQLQQQRAYTGSNPTFMGMAPINDTFIVDCAWFLWTWDAYYVPPGDAAQACRAFIKKRWNPLYDRCYTFQAPNNASMGLSLILYLNNFPPFLINSTTLRPDVSITAGARVFIHPPNTYPLMLEGTNVSPGTEVTIGLIQTNVTSLPEPYGPCTSQPLLDPLDPTSFGYTQAACLSVCGQQQKIDACGCLVTSEAYTARQLIEVNYTMCNHRLMENASEVDVMEILELPKCDYYNVANDSLCDCQIPCLDVQFDQSTTVAAWPNTPNQLGFYQMYIQPYPDIYPSGFNQYGQLLLQTPNMTVSAALDAIDSVGLITNNFIQINVLFRKESMLTNTDMPAVTWDTLFSNLGGALNLWMGITVLFAAEVVELLFHIVSLYCSKDDEDEEFGPPPVPPALEGELSPDALEDLESEIQAEVNLDPYQRRKSTASALRTGRLSIASGTSSGKGAKGLSVAPPVGAGLF